MRLRILIFTLLFSIASLAFGQGGGVNITGGKVIYGGKVLFGGSGPPTCTTTTGHSYTTAFPLTENPMSECNSWINGGVTGLDWNNFQTTPAFAKGIEASTHPGFDDPTAIVQGAWGNDQEVWGTIVAPTGGTSNTDKEIELRLRTNISAHSITGYEMQLTPFQTTTSGCGTTLIRWNGILGDFTPVAGGSLFGGAAAQCLVTGDKIRATITGTTIEYFINGILRYTNTDATYASGSPGIGAFIQSGVGLTIDYGYSAFGASDTPFRVQQSAANVTAASGTTVAATLANTTTGNMIWCIGYWADQARTATVSDVANGTYTANANGPTNGTGALAAYRAQTFWKMVVTGATTPAITLTISGSAAAVDRAVACHEVRGPVAVDQSTAIKAGTGTTMSSNTSSTTTAAHEYIAAGCVAGGTYSPLPPPPWTQELSGTFANNVTADQIVVVTGTYQFTATQTNATFLCALDTFK